MDMRTRIAGRCASVKSETDDIILDLDSFLMRLLLYDTYILDSIRLEELPILIDSIGLNNFEYLIKKGILVVHCDLVSIASIGHQESFLRPNRPALPFGSFAFRTIRSRTHYDYVKMSLQNLHKSKSYSKKEISKLKRNFAPKIKGYPSDTEIEILDQLHQDIRTNSQIIQTTLNKVVQKRYGASKDEIDLKISFKEIFEGEFQVFTNLQEVFGISEKECHNILQTSLFGIANLHRREAEMKLYTAISGFNENDLEIVEEKWSLLQNQLSEQKLVAEFQRVQKIFKFPNMEIALREKKLDFELFLKIRESDECKEFRNWLWGSDSISEDEMKKRLVSISSRIGSNLNTKSGKIIRFVFCNIVGMVPGVGQLLGLGIGSIDSFLLDKWFNTSGPTHFINSLYPSIFE